MLPEGIPALAELLVPDGVPAEVTPTVPLAVPAETPEVELLVVVMAWSCPSVPPADGVVVEVLIYMEGSPVSAVLNAQLLAPDDSYKKSANALPLATL